MQTVEVRELHERTSEVLRRVREDGEAFEVTDAGQVVARLVPVRDSARPPLSLDEWRARWHRLSGEVSAHWSGPADAVEAVREQRRDL